MPETLHNQETRKIRDQQPGKIDEILRRFPQKKSASIPLLYLAWDIYGYISPEAMIEVAEILDVSPAYIQGIVSFYTMFPLKMTGNYHIEVCANISCHLTGAQEVLKTLENRLGIHCGERTGDGRFSLQAVECLAGCSSAPCMQINGKEYTHLTPEKVIEIIDSLD
ncbi:MAG: NAD(P)H-dependent oxidoreductase subunit E [Candidatus Omnitrophica bacterium]|nr:NAD(P)H-dependent oxidoreductase subunit E [Candidatus Omnitrophota bacterium]